MKITLFLDFQDPKNFDPKFWVKKRIGGKKKSWSKNCDKEKFPFHKNLGKIFAPKCWDKKFLLKKKLGQFWMKKGLFQCFK